MSTAKRPRKTWRRDPPGHLPAGLSFGLWWAGERIGTVAQNEDGTWHAVAKLSRSQRVNTRGNGLAGRMETASAAKAFVREWIKLALSESRLAAKGYPRVCMECGHAEGCHDRAPEGHLHRFGSKLFDWFCSPKRAPVWCKRDDGKRVCGAWRRAR